MELRRQFARQAQDFERPGWVFTDEGLSLTQTWALVGGRRPS